MSKHRRKPDWEYQKWSNRGAKQVLPDWVTRSDDNAGDWKMAAGTWDGMTAVPYTTCCYTIHNKFSVQSDCDECQRCMAHRVAAAFLDNGETLWWVSGSGTTTGTTTTFTVTTDQRYSIGFTGFRQVK